MKNLDVIKAINPNCVNSDGSIKSFKEQLLELEWGLFDTSYHLVLSKDSSALRQAGLNDYPITVIPETIIKMKQKHDLEFSVIADIPSVIQEHNALLMQSYTRDNSLVMYLDIDNNEGVPLFATFHLEEETQSVNINRLTSMYDRKNIEFTIAKTMQEGLDIYTNENTEKWLKTHGVQFPSDLTTLLNCSRKNDNLDILFNKNENLSPSDIFSNAKDRANELNKSKQSISTSKQKHL